MARPDAQVEVIDPDLGAPMSARPEPGRLRPLTVIVTLAGMLGLAAVVATVAHDDPPPAPPEPEPTLGMFELDRIDLFDSPRADETPFPLFGRTWGRTLLSGAVVDVADARRFAVLGDRVLAERDGEIEIRTPDGEARIWAAGELLAAGTAAVVWRECPQPDCATWTGTVDHPTAQSIGVDMDRTIESRRLALWLGPFTLPVLSPGGRYAPGMTAGVPAVPGLIDLVDGDTIATLAPLQWTDDLSAIITLVEPTVALVDTDTGEVARIPLLEAAGARKGTLVTVVPTDELPDLRTIE